MSGRATGWVGEHGPHPDDVDRDGRAYKDRARGLRFVLMAVADAANKEGLNSHPGHENVASFALYSVGQARRLLTDLVAEGWLEIVEQGSGPGHASEYNLITDDRNTHLQSRASCTPLTAVKARVAPAQGARGGVQGARPGARPTVYPTEDPTRARTTAVVDNVEGLADFGPRPLPARPADVDEVGAAKARALRSSLRTREPSNGPDTPAVSCSEPYGQTSGESEAVSA